MIGELAMEGAFADREPTRDLGLARLAVGQRISDRSSDVGASSVIEPFYAICLVVELAFAIRLVTRGLATPTYTTARRPVTVAA